MVSIVSRTAKISNKGVQREMLMTLRCFVFIAWVALYVVSLSHKIDPTNLEAEIPRATIYRYLPITRSQKEFLDQNCEVDSKEWQLNNTWQARAPAFLVIGAKKCGTTSIFKYLAQHPNAMRPRTKELLFFIPHRFQHWEIPNNFDSKVLVRAARNEMYSKDYPAARLQHDEMSFSFEATPDYLVFSNYSAKAILCTVPWVKIVVIMRNPVDRIVSHFNFLQDKSLTPPGYNGPSVSFDSWVRKDLKRLMSFGLVGDDVSMKNFFGSQQERDAWNAYQNISTGMAEDRPLARGLYALQLEGWFEAFRSIGRDPKSEFLFVRHEDLKLNPAQVCSKIFDWVGVERYTIDAALGKDHMVTTYSAKIENKTRELLERFYYPYNQRLSKLLGEEWEGVWNPKPKSQNAVSLEDEFPSESLSTTQESFLRDNCDLGAEESWWIQKDAADSWRLRAPYFLLIGTKKGGTTSLYHYLTRHPKIVRGSNGRDQKELHSFHPRYGFPQWDTRKKIGSRVHVGLARTQLYERHYINPDLRLDSGLISFDATPEYLLYSSLSPKAILCTVPWVKILVSLRNPIDRLFSNYNFLKTASLVPEASVQKMNKITFEEFVETDMKFLRELGVLQSKIPEEEFYGSETERSAWRQYQLRNSASERPVARSMYALQIEEWFDWLRAADRDPSEVLFVTEEDLKANANDVVARIVEWLGLPAHKINTTTKSMVSHYDATAMKPETRAKLQAFFAPYNKRLYKLLGSQWEGIWDEVDFVGA